MATVNKLKVKSMKRLLLLTLTSISVLSLSGCTNTALNKQVSDSYANNHAKINRHLADAASHKNFIYSKGRFVDKHMQDLLPSWYNKKIEMHAYQVSLVNAMNILTKNTGLKIIYGDNLKNTLININYAGTMHGALEHILHKNNIAYAIEGSDQMTIRWSEMQTKTFDIAYMPGDTTFSIGGTTAKEDTNSAQLKGNVSVWNDIKDTVSKMLSKTGHLDISQSTSTVTVSDHPLAIERIAKFVKSYNKALSMRVTLHMKILEVQLNKKHQ